jgi:NADPH-NAD transhydrogenase beta subunit
MLALTVGMITLVGSLIAAGKLHKLLPQRPVIWPNHSMFTSLLLILTVGFVVLGSVSIEGFPLFWAIIGGLFFSSLFGLFFSIRVGGADMPITISLLNSLSGVAGAIAGMAVGDILLVAVGGIQQPHPTDEPGTERRHDGHGLVIEQRNGERRFIR